MISINTYLNQLKYTEKSKVPCLYKHIQVCSLHFIIYPRYTKQIFLYTISNCYRNAMVRATREHELRDTAPVLSTTKIKFVNKLLLLSI